MKKIWKNGKLYIIGIIIVGIAIGLTTVVADTIINSTSVAYKTTTVKAALDELYEKSEKMNTYKEMVCPGCVYRASTAIKFNINSTNVSKTDENSKLSSSEYTTDYTTLNSNYFLGHVIDGVGHILSSYACGINNGTFFCLRGVDSSQSSLTYKPFYQENVNIMNKVFSGCNATTSSSNVYCSGDVLDGVNVFASGTVYVSSGSSRCAVLSGGDSRCTE